MIAYELRESYRGTVQQVLTVDEAGDPVDTREVPLYSGGVLNAGDRDLNVLEELEAGNGKIVVDDADPHTQGLVMLLDEYPALKRVAAGDADASLNPFAGRNARDLRDEAKRLGLEVEPGTKVDELRAGLAEQASRAGGGDELVVPSDTRTVTIKADGSIEALGTTNPEA